MGLSLVPCLTIGAWFAIAAAVAMTKEESSKPWVRMLVRVYPIVSAMLSTNHIMHHATGSALKPMSQYSTNSSGGLVCTRPPHSCGCLPLECDQCSQIASGLTLCSTATIAGGTFETLGMYYGGLHYLYYPTMILVTLVPSATFACASFIAAPLGLSEFELVLKPMFAGCRPLGACNRSPNDFPSGHCFTSMYLLTCLWIYARSRSERETTWRAGYLLPATLFWLPQGYFRYHIDVHTLEAVVASAILAPCVAFAAMQFHDRLLATQMRVAEDPLWSLLPSMTSTVPFDDLVPSKSWWHDGKEEINDFPPAEEFPLHERSTEYGAGDR